MPWREVDTMYLRSEFVRLAELGELEMAELCRRYQISRKTGYKWLDRARIGGEGALLDRSRRPRHSPQRTAPTVEAQLVELRCQHPAWGPRKLRRVLHNRGEPELPAVSTVAAILRRHGLIDEKEAAKHSAFIRFEHAQPNDLWQMDFMGDFAVASGRCHTLTALDDHSRFNLVLAACADQTTETVQQPLIGTFRRYGLPLRMTMDNGPPWGNGYDRHDFTPLAVWLMRLGIGVSHSRPYHPQTQGKDERFHRTLQAEALAGRHFSDLTQVQQCLDDWRPLYNGVRPHEALDMQVPQQRYRPSPRSYPERLPPLEYGPGDTVRKVQARGWLTFRGRAVHVPKALKSQPVALRATGQDGIYEVYFGPHQVAAFDLRTAVRA
jgi:transposase InsO family protein